MGEITLTTRFKRLGLGLAEAAFWVFAYTFFVVYLGILQDGALVMLASLVCSLFFFGALIKGIAGFITGKNPFEEKDKK